MDTEPQILIGDDASESNKLTFCIQPCLKVGILQWIILGIKIGLSANGNGARACAVCTATENDVLDGAIDKRSSISAVQPMSMDVYANYISDRITRFESKKEG